MREIVVLDMQEAVDLLGVVPWCGEGVLTQEKEGIFAESERVIFVQTISQLVFQRWCPQNRHDI